MKLFDTFLNDIRARRIQKNAKQEMSREEARTRLRRVRMEMEAKLLKAKQMSQLSIRKCREAMECHNKVDLQIAKAQLRMHYAMFLYASSLQNNLKILTANLEMQEMTESFAKVVQSMADLKIPEGQFDFNKLTQTALRTLSPVDLKGADSMLRTVIEGSLNATDMLGGSEVSDAFLERLINDESILEHETYAGVTEAIVQGNTDVQENSAFGANKETRSFDELLKQLSQGLDS